MQNIAKVVMLFAMVSCDYAFPVNEIGPLAPKGPAYVGPLVVDFRYYNSLNFPGYVRFVNLSQGMVYYEWDFGFKDANGQPVISYVPKPNIRFPANGWYGVTLKAKGPEGQQLVRSMPVQVTNL